MTEKSNLKIEELAESKPTRDSRWQRLPDIQSNDGSSISYISNNLQDLIQHQAQTNLEITKITENKNLSKKDRQIAIKSVRSLSRTIDDLLNQQKSKLSEQIES